MKIVSWQSAVLVALAILFGHDVTSQDTPGPSGYVTVVTIPGSGYDYRISFSDTIRPVTQHTKPESSIHISRNLHDGKTTVVIGSLEYKRTLILTDTTIEVYEDDISNFRSVLVLSLELVATCTPWYIQLSSDDPEKIYVEYRPDCAHTQFSYSEGEFSPASNQPYQGIVLSTKDYEDVIVSIEENAQKIRVKEISADLSSLIPVSDIADCSRLESLYPLDPLSEGTISFAIACTTADGSNKLYHAVYQYTQYGASFVTTNLDLGTPKSQGRFVAVIRSNGRLTLYDAFDLENGIPGRRRLAGEIERALFIDDSWLVVQIENSNVYLVDIHLFISSRSREGVFELSDTNIGPCDPTCLPVIAFQNYLGVFKQDAPDSFALAVFDLATGTPQEVIDKRVSNIPERPFAAIYIEDPTLPPPDTTTSPQPTTTQATTEPEALPIVDQPLEADTTLTTIISSTAGFIVVALLIVIASTVAIGWWIKKKRHERYEIARSGGSTPTGELNGDPNTEPVNPQETETTFTDRVGLTLDLSGGNPDQDDEEHHTTPTTPLLPEPIPEVNQPVIRAEENMHRVQQVTAEGDQGAHTIVLH